MSTTLLSWILLTEPIEQETDWGRVFGLSTTYLNECRP